MRQRAPRRLAAAQVQCGPALAARAPGSPRRSPHRSPCCPPGAAPQTHSELAETRAELEQLADDILAIKLLMEDEDGEEEDGAAAYDAAAPSYYYDRSASSSGSEEDALDVLESLAALSRQLAADAAEDDAIVQSLAAWPEEGEEQGSRGAQ